MADGTFRSGDRQASSTIAKGDNTDHIQWVTLVDEAGEPAAGAATEAKQDTQITHLDGLEGVLGTTAGAAVVTDANGTIQQYLRGIIVQWAAFLTRLPAALAANGGLKVEGVAGGVAQPVSGPQTNTEFLAALRSTAAFTTVNSGTASVTILASNAARKGAVIANSDANALYLDLTGGTATTTARYAKKLLEGESYEVPFGITGAITGIWAADGSGVAMVTEAS